METKYWFKKRKGVTDFGRPANWKGWATLFVFIFLFAFVVQMIARWFTLGMAPMGQGVWLGAMLFILIGVFLRLCNQFSPPSDEA